MVELLKAVGEREGRSQFSFRWCVQKSGYLGPLKHSLQRSIFKGVRACLRFVTVPIQGLWEFVLGISSMSQGSFLCLYHLAGKGLLMTNLCPWGTEPRQRCCCWAGRPPMTGPGSCWNSLLLTPLSPGLAPMQNQILSICSKTTAFGEEDWTQNPPRALKVHLQPKTISVSTWFLWVWGIHPKTAEGTLSLKVSL